MLKEYTGGVGPLAPDIIAAVKASSGIVVELGVYRGEGSLTMIQDALEDHPSPLHISVDWDESNLAPENRPPVNWWYFVKGDTRLAATANSVKQILGNHKAGVIFIDTDHNYDQMKAELELWSQFADDSTVWLFHDTHMYGVPNVEMVSAITEYAEANGWRYDEPRKDSHGLGRMRR